MRSCSECGASFKTDAQFCSIDGSPLLDQKTDPLVKNLLDRYLIFEPLGSGGVARVYRARHLFLEHNCALKVLFGDFLLNPARVERFRREAQAASLIRHGNVVQVFDYGVSTKGLVFMAQEYLEGRSLAELLDAGQRPNRVEMVQLMRQIASGLAAAHARGLVHRDLKPANIMIVEQQRRAKIVDFGLVGYVPLPEEQQRLTRPGETFGTPGYMAPEQIEAKPTDGRTDLYALGVILYELLSGKLPFEGESKQVLAQALARPPPPLPGRGTLEKLTMLLLEKSPDARPKSAEAVLAILDRVAAVEETTDEVALSDIQAVRSDPIRRRTRARWPEQLAALAIATLTGGILARSLAPAAPGQPAACLADPPISRAPLPFRSERLIPTATRSSTVAP
jgi:serine/threonine-protein kinase